MNFKITQEQIDEILELIDTRYNLEAKRILRNLEIIKDKVESKLGEF